MEYYCTICEKKYKSYKSLWKHNYIYHKKEDIQNIQSNIHNIHSENIQNIQNNIQNKCIKCDKILSNYYSKWRHEKTCKEIKKEEENKMELLIKENLEIKQKLENKNEKENIEMKKEMLEYKKEMEKLKDMLQKALKIHPKTLTKINKQLNNTNNGIINNNIIVQLGRENLSEILSNKEKIGILNRQAMGLNDLIELVHASGKYKQFMNVCITNLQNTIAYKFDEKANSFIAVNKNELLNDLVDSRVYDIEKFFEEYQTKFEPKKVEQIKKFIERMSNEEDSLKGIKKEEIKLILYNNLEKIKSNESEMIKIDDKEINV